MVRAGVISEPRHRLFTEQGIPESMAGGGEARSLDGGEFILAPDMGGERIGAQIAQTLYQGWNR